MKTKKNFNLFIFLSTFARNLIDVFIPIILYKKGLSIHHLFIFIMINYALSFIFNIPLSYIAKKITFKWLLIISSIFVSIAYYFLLIKPISIFSLSMILIMHVICAHTYWLSRHYYSLAVLPKENMGDEVGDIVILSQISLVPATYLGALLIKHLHVYIVLLIVALVYIISALPLFKVNEIKRRKTKSILKTTYYTLTQIPIRSIIFFIFAQFRFVSKYLFPLFIFLHVRNTLEYIGVLNIAIGIASVFFVYFYARKMDKEKKDYLILSGVLSFIVYIFKLNITSTLWIVFICFFEGLIEKMYETSFTRNLYALGKHYHPIAYGASIEGLQSIIRVIIMFIFIFIVKDLKISLIICSIGMLIAGLIGFDDGKGGY
jgi:MFS family permease